MHSADVNSIRRRRAGERLCWAAVFVAFAIGLAAAFGRCFSSDRFALATSIPDDRYYYFLPALNFWKYGFFTFDGVHPTYGFQPLWQLLLTVIGAVVPDREQLLRVGLFIPHILRALTAILLFDRGLNARRSAQDPPNVASGLLMVALYWGSIPLFFMWTNGKENALYGLLLVAMWRMLARMPDLSTREGVALGVCGALILLTRITPASVLVVATVFAWIGLRSRGVFKWFVAGFVPPLMSDRQRTRCRGAPARGELRTQFVLAGRCEIRSTGASVERQG